MGGELLPGVSPVFVSFIAALDYSAFCIRHVGHPPFPPSNFSFPMAPLHPSLPTQTPTQGEYRLALFLLLYYAYRSVYPTKEWAFVRNIYRAGNRYFYPQEVLFDGFKEIKPDSRSLICMHPHGILTIGWALTSTSPTMTHANVKWLVTEALLRLPFIR